MVGCVILSVWESVCVHMSETTCPFKGGFGPMRVWWYSVCTLGGYVHAVHRHLNMENYSRVKGRTAR